MSTPDGFIDPYKDVSPRGLLTPATHLVQIIFSDEVPLPLGIKGLRIANNNVSWAVMTVRMLSGHTTTFMIPPNSLIVEPLRVTHVLSNTSNWLVVQGYTDADEGSLDGTVSYMND